MSIFNKGKILAAQREPVQKKHRILLVDDEEANLRALDALLNRKYHILTAANGLVALETLQGAWRDQEIHLVISDHRMPEMSGTVFLQQVVELLPRSIRILLTAYQDVNIILDSINRAQIYKFILKPYDRDDLLITVERALELYETQVELDRYRASLEAQVEQRSRALVQQAKYSALGSMILGMADRLKNPMNYVDGLSRVCGELVDEVSASLALPSDKDTLQTLNELKSNLELITKNGKRLNTMVEGMMKLSLEGVMGTQLVDLPDLLLENADLASHRIHAIHGDFEVQIKSDFDPNCTVIEVEVQSFSRALNAIFSNAVEALHEMISQSPSFVPELSLRTSALPEWVEIVIRDNGIGIADQELNHVCDHFYTTKSSEQGHVGLGLPMALDFIRTHGGDLQLESRQHEYTEVRVTLPYKAVTKLS